MLETGNVLASILNSPRQLKDTVKRRLSGIAPGVASLLFEEVSDAEPQPPAATATTKEATATTDALGASMKGSKRSRAEPRIKTEAERSQPFRAKRHQHKSGFYSESNLASLAWKGDGSKVDPIQL